MKYSLLSNNNNKNKNDNNNNNFFSGKFWNFWCLGRMLRDLSNIPLPLHFKSFVVENHIIWNYIQSRVFLKSRIFSTLDRYPFLLSSQFLLKLYMFCISPSVKFKVISLFYQLSTARTLAFNFNPMKSIREVSKNYLFRDFGHCFQLIAIETSDF